MSGALEGLFNSGFSRITFPPLFGVFVALKVSQLCRIGLTWAVVKDEKQFGLLVIFDTLIFTLPELALAFNKRSTRKRFGSVVNLGEEYIGSASLRGSSNYFSAHNDPSRHSTARSASIRSRRSRSGLSSKRQLAPCPGSRTNSRFSALPRLSALLPFERFLSPHDFQVQADIGRLAGEGFLREDWEQELLLVPGFTGLDAPGPSRIGMKIRKPPSIGRTTSTQSTHDIGSRASESSLLSRNTY